MSAGITSACLPTLSPVMFLVLRKLGVKGSILSRSADTHPSSLNNNLSYGRKQTGPTSTATMKTAGGGHRGVVEAELPRSKKDAAGAFYRLPDDNTSGDTATDKNTTTSSDAVPPVDAELRPDHGYAYTVTSKPGKRGGGRGSLSGDEIPLHGIRVHTDFKQSAS